MARSGVSEVSTQAATGNDDTAQIQSTDSSTMSLDAHLLSLSAELRNEIYSLVLISPSAITVTVQDHNEPALLRVNRQIRAEAAGLYYHLNTFNLWVVDCNGAVFAPLFASFDLHTKKKTGPVKMVFSYGGADNWNNLVAWIEAAHRDRMCSVWGEQFPEEIKEWRGGDELFTVVLMFDLMWTLEDLGLEWDVMEGVLQKLRPALVKLDEAWGKD